MELKTTDDIREALMTLIDNQGLTVDDLIDITGYKRQTINKLVKSKHVGGFTICDVWNKLQRALKWLMYVVGGEIMDIKAILIATICYLIMFVITTALYFVL